MSALSPAVLADLQVAVHAIPRPEGLRLEWMLPHGLLVILGEDSAVGLQILPAEFEEVDTDGVPGMPRPVAIYVGRIAEQIDAALNPNPGHVLESYPATPASEAP